MLFITFMDMGGVGCGSSLQCWFLVKEYPFLLAQAWSTLLLSFGKELQVRRLLS